MSAKGYNRRTINCLITTGVNSHICMIDCRLDGGPLDCGKACQSIDINQYIVCARGTLIEPCGPPISVFLVTYWKHRYLTELIKCYSMAKPGSLELGQETVYHKN